MNTNGERVRIHEQLTRLRALVDGLETTIDMKVPCSENAQAVADAAMRLVTIAGRLDAYSRMEPLLVEAIHIAEDQAAMDPDPQLDVIRKRAGLSERDVRSTYLAEAAVQRIRNKKTNAQRVRRRKA